jgi:hypothetical protein
VDAFFVVALTIVLLAVGVWALVATRPVLAAVDRPEAERPVDPAQEPTVVLSRNDEDR